MHPRLPQLFSSFGAFKCEQGSRLEKAMYNDMSQHDLVARSMKKRPLVLCR